MEFVRKKRRGQSQKVHRTWFSDGGYRITWRKEVYAVRVPARFQACVRILVPHGDGTLRESWDFADHQHGLTKTLKAAIEQCERHKSLWERACEVTGIRALRELFGGKLPLGLPLWAKEKMDRRLYAILIDNRPMHCRDDEEAESCTESMPPSSDASGPGGPPHTSDPSALPTEAPLGISARPRGRLTLRRKDAATSSASTRGKRINGGRS